VRSSDFRPKRCIFSCDFETRWRVAKLTLACAAAELASSIAGPKMLRVDSLKEDPLGHLLRDLHANMYNAKWFTSEKWRDKDADE